MTFAIVHDPGSTKHAVLRHIGPGVALERRPALQSWVAPGEQWHAPAVVGMNGSTAVAVFATPAASTSPDEVDVDERPRIDTERDTTALVWELGGHDGPRRIAFKSPQPYAVTVRDSRLYLGVPGEVRTLQLDVEQATTTTLVDVIDDIRKPYDHFRWCGNDLWAFDDCVSPHFGARIHVPAAGEPAVVRRFLLPSHPNGRYLDFAVIDDAAGNDIAYAVLNARVMLGRGSTLYELPLDKLHPLIPGMVDERAGDGDWRRIDEFTMDTPNDVFADRGPLVGSRNTPFLAVAVTPTSRRVLVAAGERGILIWDPARRSNTVTQIETADPCTDVCRVGASVYALTHTPGTDITRVLEVEDGVGRLRLGVEATLRGSLTAFVR